MIQCKEKAKGLMILFLGLSLVLIAFIWSNSLTSREESAAGSSIIASFLKPILDPSNRLDEDTFRSLVRKLAHFAEFCALGLSVGGFSVQLGKVCRRKYLALPALITLLTAVADEYIQLFSGRGSQVSDVVLDFAGALFGLGLVALICAIMRKK